MKQKRPEASFRKIVNMVHVSLLPSIVDKSLDLGLFESLTEPMGADELADKMMLDKSVLESLLDVLVSGEYLKESGGKYSLESVSSDFLVKSSPFYQGDYIKKLLKESGLADSISRALTDGPGKFDSKAFCRAEVLKQFGEVAKTGSMQDLSDFAMSLPGFENMTSVCDVAGSYGYMAMGLLEVNPNLKGCVYDLPEVAELAKDFIKEAGYSDRFESRGFDLAAGDSFGEGYDIVIASNCLHMFDDSVLKGFYKKLYESLNDGGVFISCHLDMDAEGDDLITETVKELMVRAYGVKTHHMPVKEMKSNLESVGFKIEKVRPGKESSFFNINILAARK